MQNTINHQFIFLFGITLTFMPNSVAQQPVASASESVNQKAQKEAVAQAQQSDLLPCWISGLFEGCKDLEPQDIYAAVVAYVNAGNNIHAKTTNQENLLHLTCRYKRSLEAVQFLLDKGAKMEDEDQFKNTALLRAISVRDTETSGVQLAIVKELIKRGANITARNNVYGDSKGVKEITEETMTSLKGSYPSLVPDYERIKSFVLDSKTYPTAAQAKDQKIQTEAPQASDKKIPNWLNHTLKTQSHSEEDCIAAMETYLKIGNIHDTDSQGRNLLHLVCTYKNGPEAVEFLLKKDIQKEATDAQGNTPLACAVQADSKRLEKQKAVVQKLLAAGAHIDPKKIGDIIGKGKKIIKKKAPYYTEKYDGIYSAVYCRLLEPIGILHKSMGLKQ